MTVRVSISDAAVNSCEVRPARCVELETAAAAVSKDGGGSRDFDDVTADTERGAVDGRSAQFTCVYRLSVRLINYQLPTVVARSCQSLICPLFDLLRPFPLQSTSSEQ